MAQWLYCHLLTEFVLLTCCNHFMETHSIHFASWEGKKDLLHTKIETRLMSDNVVMHNIEIMFNRFPCPVPFTAGPFWEGDLLPRCCRVFCGMWQRSGEERPRSQVSFSYVCRNSGTHQVRTIMNKHLSLSWNQTINLLHDAVNVLAWRTEKGVSFACSL